MLDQEVIDEANKIIKKRLALNRDYDSDSTIRHFDTSSLQ